MAQNPDVITDRVIKKLRGCINPVALYKMQWTFKCLEMGSQLQIRAEKDNHCLVGVYTAIVKRQVILDDVVYMLEMKDGG